MTRLALMALLALAILMPPRQAAAQDAIGGAIVGGAAGAIPGRAIGGGRGAAVGAIPGAPRLPFSSRRRRRGWPGHRRAEATPSFGRLCPAMTKDHTEIGAPSRGIACGLPCSSIAT